MQSGYIIYQIQKTYEFLEDATATRGIELFSATANVPDSSGITSILPITVTYYADNELVLRGSYEECQKQKLADCAEVIHTDILSVKRTTPTTIVPTPAETATLKQRCSKRDTSQ
jgi:hypothetical protein